MDHKDIVIIGAGPAGSAAAIQLRRYNLSPLVFEANQIGGLLRNADRIENYPGFSEGIAGQDLVKLLKDHLRNAGAAGLERSHPRHASRAVHGGTHPGGSHSRPRFESGHGIGRGRRVSIRRLPSPVFLPPHFNGFTDP